MENQIEDNGTIF